MTKPIIILGSGGHAKVLISVLSLHQIPILGATDSDPGKHGKELLGVPILGSDDIVLKYATDSVNLVNAIGSVQLPTIRISLYQKFKEMGYKFATVIHPSAIIAPQVLLGEGTQVMAGAVIQVGSQIGENSIINTGVVVDHDCQIGAHVHLAPGTVLSGGVTVGEGSHLGTGTTVIQNISIGSQTLIGAGSVVIKNIPSRRKAWGIPAKLHENN